VGERKPPGVHLVWGKKRLAVGSIQTGKSNCEKKIKLGRAKKAAKEEKERGKHSGLY